MAKEEQIILVKKEHLFKKGQEVFQGTLFDKELVEKFLESIDAHEEVMRRGGTDEVDVPVENCAELNFDYKQPIPYIVINKGEKFFVTERLEGAGEARLHGKLAMGVGGHMNPIENVESFLDVLHENTLRELDEELIVHHNGESIDIVMNGLLNDDSDSVGQVHIALLGKINLKENQDLEIKEVEQLKGHWFTLEELLSPEIFPRLESWGKIVVKALESGEMKM